MTTIRVIGPPNDGYKAVYYGVKAGIFAKYGLNVETSLVNNGAVAAAALSAGAAEVAYTNLLTVLLAKQHAVPMQFIAPAVMLDKKTRFTMALVLKGSPIASGRDMNGKTIASSGIHDINTAVFYAWIDKTGGDSSTTREIEVPASAGAQFLEEHRADVVLLNEPAVSQALASGEVQALVNPYAALGTVEAAGFAVMAPAVEKNPDIYSRFARAMHEASAYTNSHLAETVDLVAAYSGATPDQIAHSVRNVDPPYLDPRILQPLSDVCAKYGLIDKPIATADIISPQALKPSAR